MEKNKLPLSFWLKENDSKLFQILKKKHANFYKNKFNIKASFFYKENNIKLKKYKNCKFFMGDTDVYENLY